jgi:hypothetical protein
MAEASRHESLASLEAKVHAYCEASQEAKPAGLPEYATQLRQEGNLATLSAVAKEVDTWLREIHTPEQQSAIATYMLSRGVLHAHLPPSVERAVRKLVRRGRIATQAEARFVKELLVNPSVVGKYASDAEVLQTMLVPWDSKA